MSLQVAQHATITPSDIEQLLPADTRLISVHQTDAAARREQARIAMLGVTAQYEQLPVQCAPRDWAVYVPAGIDRASLLRALYPRWEGVRI